MKAVAPVGNERSSETAEALRLAVDTTPAYLPLSIPRGFRRKVQQLPNV